MGRGLKRVALAASTALTLATALLVGTASAAGADPLPDLSSRAAIEQYLVSIGVDPATAVWQTGLKNYAGPGCPGLGWNCVRANAPIVQIAAPLGTNLFACGGVDCVAVQTALQGGNNGAGCLRTDKHDNPALQVCDITQANDGNPNSSNTATINQSIEQNTGSPQDARQVARITQDNGSGKNIATIHQVIAQTQNASGANIVQSQEAHQAGTVSQETDTGDNSSNIDQRQKQTQRASAAGTSTMQSQNTGTGTNTDPFACDQPEGLYNQQKNQCADITQVSGLVDLVGPVLLPGGGNNSSSLNHQISQGQMASRAGTVDQSQGAFASGEAGNKLQLSTGVSQGSALQDMSQSQSAPANAIVNQSQQTGDPRCCWEQAVNTANRANIDQTTLQTASDPNAFQSAVLQADCDSTGICHVTQKATIDGFTVTESCDAPSCHPVTFNSSGGD